MASHEIITLQFGGFANYVGAHYWNIQDELLGLQEAEGSREAASQIESSVLFRQGKTLRGDPTYTPRLVLFDASDSLGAATAGGSLYGDAAASAEASAATWGGSSEVFRSPQVAASSFIHQLEVEGEGEAGGEAAEPGPLETAARGLDSPHGVRYFTDYLKAQLHPNSTFLLEGVWQGAGTLQGWGGAASYFATEERREAASDRIRKWAEECDSLGGFQCFVEDLSVWGKAAGHVLQEVRDQYGGARPVVLFALRPSGSATVASHVGSHQEATVHAQTRQRRLCEGLSLATLSQQCDLFVPVAPPCGGGAAGLPLMHWQQGNWYHESALCAAAIDSATLPYRLSRHPGGSGPLGSLDAWGMSQLLTAQHGSPLAALSVACPAPSLPRDLQKTGEQADTRSEHLAAGVPPAANSLTALTAQLSMGVGGSGDRQRFAEVVVLRGARTGGAAATATEAAETLDAALLAEGVRCVQHRAVTTQAMPVPLPFPDIFARTVNKYGDVESAHPASTGHQVASCPALVRLAGSAAFGPEVHSVAQRFAAAAATAQGHTQLEGWGYSAEERGELEEQLLQLAHKYEEEE